MSNIIHPDDKFVNSNGPKLIFMGTPEFSVPILEKLINSEYKPVAVFCAPDKPVGRKQILTPPPVKVITQKYAIPVFQPKDKTELSHMLLAISPTLVITAAYGLIFPKEVLDAPKFGCLNIHPSLLPRYRGPSPIQSAILNGDETTGVTIYKMDEKVDTGSIIVQEKISLNAVVASANSLERIGVKQSRDIAAVHRIAASPLDKLVTPRNDKPTTPELSQVLSNFSADLLIRTLPDWLAGKITVAPQNDSVASYTKIITKEDGKINWQKSAQEIEQQIRAYTPWPGSYANLKYKNENIKIKFLGADFFRPPYAKGGWGVKILSLLHHCFFSNPLNPPLQGGQKRQPGEIFLAKTGQLAVQTGSGALIIKNLQLEGGKPLSAQDFMRGHKDVVGKILE